MVLSRTKPNNKSSKDRHIVKSINLFLFSCTLPFFKFSRERQGNTICELPDDILLHIVSFLTTKEAGRTSVLSKRWRYISANNRSLNLDSRDICTCESDELSYIICVNQVLRSHKAPTIDEFRLRFKGPSRRGKFRRDSIGNWFSYAMEKKVKKLELDLSRHNFIPQYISGEISLCKCNSLTSFVLVSASICGETLENFLNNCQALEYLSVTCSDSLKHLKVSGTSLNLRHLVISECYMIKLLEISAPNLESLHYSGLKINLQIKSAPKLSEVTFGYAYADDLISICSDLSSCLSQIKVLTLNSFCNLQYRRLSMEESVSFAGLVKLNVVACAEWNGDLCCFSSLIEACPYLHHFKLELFAIEPRDLSSHKWMVQRRREACPHYNLKIVEIRGFAGYTLDLEFATYLLESAISLEKIIVDTRPVPTDGIPNKFVDRKERRLARKQAQQLLAYLKPSVERYII